MAGIIKQLWLGIEFALLFFGIPLLIYFDPEFIHPSMLIIPLLVIIFVVLRFTTDFRFKDLVYLRIDRRRIRYNALILVICAILMLISVLIFFPERLFDLPRGNFPVWLIFVFFYPVFSAYGQEIIYRTFLFKRYRPLFRKNLALILASGISFSFVHIVYYSPVSIILTLMGGLYLADEYARTKSVLFTAILHGILGIFVFSVGLGAFFWLDMYEWL